MSDLGDLTVRTANCLKCVDLYTLEEVGLAIHEGRLTYTSKAKGPTLDGVPIPNMGRKSWNELMEVLQVSPLPSKIGATTKQSAEAAAKAIAMRHMNLALDAGVDPRLMTADPTIVQPYIDALVKQIISLVPAALEQAINALPPVKPVSAAQQAIIDKHAAVVAMRIDRRMTFAAIAAEHGVSVERARQMFARACRKMVEDIPRGPDREAKVDAMRDRLSSMDRAHK